MPCRPLTHPKLILHEINDVLMELIHKWPSLFLSQVLEASLEDAAPVGMRRKFENATLES
jgi:hypothetical protein